MVSDPTWANEGASRQQFRRTVRAVAGMVMGAAALAAGFTASHAFGRSAALAPQPGEMTFQGLSSDTVVGGREAAHDNLALFVARTASRVSSEAGAGEIPPRLAPAEVSTLATRCAPGAPTSALVSIVRVESGFSPLTIRANGAHARIFHPATADEAASTARSLLAEGRNIDLGLAQINAKNLAPLGLSVEAAFDPCRNLAAAGEILNRGYERALRVDHANRPILQMAYSIYNTGNTEAGFFNGYASKVTAAAR